MPPVTWLASYPKSGNTWTRLLIAYYLREDLVPLGPRPLANAVAKFIPHFTSLLQAGQLVPPDHTGPLIIKTHHMPGDDDLRPYESITRKVISLVRNPRDVIPSAARHEQVPEDKHAKFAMDFIEHRGNPTWTMKDGTWLSSVQEWNDPVRIKELFPKADLLTVRYEDLRADTAGWLHRILEFLDLGEPVDSNRVKYVVEKTALERLRKEEAQHRAGLPESDRPPFPFFGDGLQNQSLAVYGDEVEAAYLKLIEEDAEFRACLQRFGYIES